jgi:hypothetical protein
VRNVSEYAKQQQCWARVSRLSLPLAPSLTALTISITESQERQRTDRATGRIDREIDFDRDLVALQPRIGEIRDFARSKRMLSPNSSKALDKVERLNLNLTKGERNALVHLFKSVQEKGFDVKKLADDVNP